MTFPLPTNPLRHVWPNAPRRDVVWFFGAVLYFVLLGGGNAGEQLAVLRGINMAIAGVLVLLWVRRAGEHDALDAAVVAGVLLFLASALLSSSMRLSFDSAIHGLAYAALFWYARRLLVREDAYAALLWILGGVCIGVAAFYAVEWGSVWLEWAQLTGFREIPPLSLPLPTGLYLGRHDVALLLVMLAPALFMPVGFGRPMAIRLIALGLVGLVLFMDGPRTVLVSMVGATFVAAVVAVTRNRDRWTGIRLGTRGRIAAAAFAVGLVAVAIPTAEPLLSRLLDFRSVSIRGELWSGAVSIWGRDPLSGSGPGTFLFALFDTAYYDTSAYFPRNPDGAPFMVLAETGLFGALGIAMLLFGMVRTPLTRKPRTALLIFGPAAFLFAGIGQVPADFGYLIVPAVLWLAAAFPPRAAVRQADAVPRRPWLAPAIRRSSNASVLIIAIAVGCTAVGGWAYEDAVRALRAGDPERAADGLQTAVRFDPLVALYWRAAGAVQLSRHEPAAALATLREADAAEPRDPVTHRLQALAYLAADDAERASQSAARALELHQSHPLHYAVAAAAARALGADELAARHVDRFMVFVPWMMGAPEWPSSLGERRTARDAGRLLDEWARDADDIDVFIQPGFLAAVAQTSRHADAIEAAATPFPRTREALGALMACEPERADAYLNRAATGERATATYWAVRLMVGRIVGDDLTNEARLGQITGLYLGAADTFASSPLGEMWAYRRVPLPRVSLPFDLPPYDGGFNAWLDDPRAAAATAQLHSLAACHVRK